MATSNFMSLEEAAAALNIGKEQLAELAKARKLRMFNDQGSQKFRRQDIEAFKKQAESGATILFQGEAKTDEESSHVNLGAVSDETAEDSKEVTEFSMEVVEDKAKKEGSSDRIDLEQVDAEPGADESDQTSVLPVADEGSGAEQTEEKPVFDFAEDDLGLAPEEPSGSVLVTEEAESSADILEVAEEVEEESSSDVVPVRDDSDVSAVADSDVVTDILDQGAEESDDELDTIDLDDVPAPAEGGAQPGGDELITVIDESATGSSADTAPLGAYETAGEEAETVSLDAAEAATEDVSGGVGDLETTGATSGGEEEAGALAGAYAAPVPMVDYLPSTPMNVALVISVVLGVFGGFMMVCEMTGATANPVVTFIREQIVDKYLNFL